MPFVLLCNGFTILNLKSIDQYFLNFLVFIYKLMNIARYNPHKQKFFGVLNNFKSVRQSSDQKV